MKEKNGSTHSTKARLVEVLRGGNGRPISGGKLATDLGISRVAVWKGIQSLIRVGYPVDTLESGYSLDPESPSDFLYHWELGENESMFQYFENTGSRFIPRFFEMWETANLACQARSCKRGLRRLLVLLPLVTEKMMEAAAETVLALEARGLGQGNE